MYKVGDFIVYAGMGICRVADIANYDVPRTDKNQLYYVLEQVYQNGCTIYTPTDTKLFMRFIVSKEEAEKLIDMIPSIKVEAYHSRTINELSEHYNKSMVSHDLLDLIELTMSIYAKKQQVTEQKRKLGAVDERFMKQAEELLFGELALALDIAKGDVQNYITERVGAISQ